MLHAVYAVNELNATVAITARFVRRQDQLLAYCVVYNSYCTDVELPYMVF